MAGSTSRRHAIQGAPEAEVEQRTMNRNPEAAAIPARERKGPKDRFGSHTNRAQRRV